MFLVSWLPDRCAVALSRVQHQLDQARTAFILQVLSQAVSEFASEPPRTVRKTACRFGYLEYWPQGSAPITLVEKGQQVAQHCDHSWPQLRFEAGGVEGNQPKLLPGVVSRNAGESEAGRRRRRRDRCPTAKAETPCTSAAGQKCRSRTTFD